MKKTIKHIIIIFIISLIIEICIFNFGYFRTLLSKEISQSVNFQITEKDRNKVITLEKPYKRITSISINYDHSNTRLSETKEYYNTDYNISYTIKYTVDGYKYYSSLSPKTYFRSEDPYFILDTNDDCINLEIYTNREILPTINSITINKPIFNFSFVRFDIVLLICLFIFEGLPLIGNKYVFDKKRPRLQLFYDIFIVVFFIILTVSYIIIQNPKLIKLESSLSNNSYMYKEPAESAKALLHNKGILDLEVSEELIDLNNPYDPSERAYYYANYSYDVSFYNNNYYSYFGIAPIISLVIPLRIITGNYFSSVIYNTIFLLFNIILSFIVYKELLKRFTSKNISTILFYLGYFAIMLGSNVLTIMSGRKYDLSITSGIFYILISMLIILSLLENDKHKLIKHLILGIALGLIVLSKPSFILYYPILFVLYLPFLAKQNKAQNAKSLISIAIPIICFAIFQMWYNYIRFDNIFEFGAKYQLTNYNMSILMSFGFGKILLGLLKYIFNLPMLDLLTFPFFTIKTKANVIGLNEYTYQNHIIGLAYIPILWILLFKKNILNTKKNPKEKYDLSNIDTCYKLLLNTTIIIGLLLIIVTTCMGGISENYIVDYKLVLCLITSILWFKFLDDKTTTKGNIEIKNKLFIIICIVSLIVYIPISYNSEVNYLTNNVLSLTNYLAHTFEFWK